MCRHSTSDADESWAPSRKIRLGGIRCPLSPADGRFARSSSFSGCIARSKDESLNYRGLDRGAHTAVRTARVTVGHVRRGKRTLRCNCSELPVRIEAQSMHRLAN
jgi:hypothetical protein